MRSKLTGYDVGALLYCPANAHGSIVGAIVEQRFPTPYSLAFCLEDTVREDAVADAERMLRGTLSRIASAAEGGSFFLPPIFVRVRSPEQLLRLAEEYAPFSSILRGFILPKFFLENCGAYLAAIRSIGRTEEYFYMPVFESAAMIPPQTRREALTEVRAQLDTVSGSILNIRVGGNDLSHAFGLRRPANRTIYDLRPVADILIDIVAAFGTQYVVSGPVWEYYSGEGWEEGLRRVDKALDYMNITEFRDRPPHYLSGGEKKRVSIADIIAMESEVIIFDEPTAALDPLNAQMLEEVLHKMGQEGRTILLSTHDVDFAYRWAERVIVFCQGKVIADDTPLRVFKQEEILKKANLKHPVLFDVYDILREKGMVPDGDLYPKNVQEFEAMMKSL